MRLGKSLPLLIALAFCGPAIAADQYCEGYKVGYKEGYAQVAGAEPTAMSPLCPAKRVRSADEKRSEFQRGYDKGLRDGIRDGSTGR